MNDDEQIHHYYLSCIQIQKKGGWRTASPNTKTHTGCDKADFKCTATKENLLFITHKSNTDEMRGLINNTVMQPEPHQRCPCPRRLHLMCFSSWVTWHPSETCCFSFQAHLSSRAALLIDTPGLLTWHGFVAACALVKHALSIGYGSHLWPTMFPQLVRAVADNGGKAPTAHVLLTILVSPSCPLSFCSCALANIPHQFLMHCHMVVLFFSSGAVTNKYEKKKNEATGKVSADLSACYMLPWLLAPSVGGQNVLTASWKGPITRYWPEADLMADVWPFKWQSLWCWL